MPTLTETLDNLYTTTWQNMKSSVSDNIFDATPFWFWLKSKGGLVTEEGGRFITEPLRFAKSDNVKFVQKGDTVDLTDKEFLTIARYDWRYMVDSIVRFGIDDQQNRGKNQIISLMQAKLDNSKDSLIDKMEAVLFGQSSDEANIGYHGLLDLVPADPTVTGATLGGIDPSVDTWWRNQFLAATTPFTTNGIADMTTLLNNCGNNIRQDTPDIIVASQTVYEAYEAEAIEIKRITNKTLADVGFINQEFKGIPMIWSGQVNTVDTAGTLGTTDKMYFLNTRFLKFKYDPMMFFDMTEWKPIVNQVNDRAAQVITAGNLITGRRRVHGILHTISS